ncbi:hypothetical protein CERSUDRAFT_114979 [Gelatoporia subvermispora B]|uniref:C2 domain-containing protein n=1 Tax=Ceriporiopsis subvermispora (strain B) TaxID=914234 RepID=M2PL86_CERS8|nr:hypothetical protein CERSUDRAFT_114979 [Gelatoporia subvermispora B]
MSHKLAEPYSGKNPVPKIATKLTSLVSPEKATEAKARQLQDQSAKNEEKQTEKTASRLAKGRTMHVTDPTTGENLSIRNAEEEPDPRSKGENVLEQGFPPPDWKQHREHVISNTITSLLYISAGYTISLLVSSFMFKSTLMQCIAVIPPSMFAYCILFRLRSVSNDDFERRVWHAERMRGLRAGSDLDGDGQVSDEERTRESAEWANAVMRGVWPIINPDLFNGVVDVIEDIMQSSVPSFVHSVRISDLGLGSNAARITAIRSLPDSTPERAGEDDEAKDIGRSIDVDAGGLGQEEREALDGDHVNLEISFVYRGQPSGNEVESKAHNIHLLVEFFLGLKGIYGVKFPVWVEVTGVVGTARARLQLISDPPFVKTTLVTLLGLPRITISATPLSEHLPNVMNIPFISGFISSALDTAAAEYVAPKSLTLDLQKLISGDDIKKDTDAIGVLVVHIHRATGVKAMDANGKSADPYVVLTFSRLGKPLYSTRIIKADCNPVFEETAVLLVDTNTVKLREKLSFQLWDSDRMSVDDMMGYEQIDIVDLIRQRGQPVRRVLRLQSPDSKARPGSLEFTAGYYGKMPPNPSLSTDGADPGIPDDLRTQPAFKQARAVALNDLEAAVLVTPPDPEWPSGILSVQVHEIRGLMVKRQGKERKGEKGKKGEKGQNDTEETTEEAEGLPSSYCMISLNDELLYQTRVKPITSSPIFNAGTERFVRDWRKSHVTVTVRDSRMREHDAVLGVVFLKLSELFVNASEITRFYSLEEGLGHGRVRISVLFRPIEAKLPPNLLGFDTGTLEIRDIAVKSDLEDFSGHEIRLKTTTSGAEDKISRKQAECRDDGLTVWPREGVAIIPVRQRYGAALLISFRETSEFKRSGRKTLAVLWLRDLVDSEEGTVEIALWQAQHDDYSRLKLNYVPPDGNLKFWDSDKEKVERIGSVFLDIIFRPGISERHHQMLSGAGSKKREAWDEFDRQKAGGMREAVGQMDERTPSSHKTTENTDTQVEDNQEPPEQKTDSTLTGGPLNTISGDHEAADENREQLGTNTLVSDDAVDDQTRGEAALDQDGLPRGQRDEEGDEERGSEGGRKGLVGKLKDWRDHEKELHRDHRGVMQVKPARTAQWVKDSVEEGAHAVKSRFKMKAREPDIETEV